MPPYFSGTGPPRSPRGAILRRTSFGKISPRSRSRAPGAISLSAKSFASLRIDCCSDVRSKSTRLLRRGALRGALADRLRGGLVVQKCEPFRRELRIAHAASLWGGDDRRSPPSVARR